MHSRAYAAQCAAVETRLPALPQENRALTLFALALGSFCIGTSEFVSMGILPLFSTSLDIDLPTDQPPDRDARDRRLCLWPSHRRAAGHAQPTHAAALPDGVVHRRQSAISRGDQHRHARDRLLHQRHAAGRLFLGQAWWALAGLPPDPTDAALLANPRLVLKKQANALVFMHTQRRGSF